jgi:F-type H+-transporting ATPase subunit delta
VSNSPVARRYAGALADLAAETEKLDAVAADLEAFGAVLAGSADLRAALTNPGFTVEERRAVVGSLFDKVGKEPITRNFLFVLVDNDRMASFADIVAAFRAAHDAKSGRVRAHVTSAATQTKTQQTALERQIKAWTGAKTVAVDVDIDPSLIGGIVTRVGDTVFDGSLRTKLDNLRNHLLGQGVVAEA